MKVYITKYALSSGILVRSAELLDSGYYSVEGYYSVFSESELFENLQDAIADAEERRIKKLKSLDKQIKKISALVFEINE